LTPFEQVGRAHLVRLEELQTHGHTLLVVQVVERFERATLGHGEQGVRGRLTPRQVVLFARARYDFEQEFE
jgi:hypothetical protein